MSVSDIERGLVARYAARILEREELPLRAMRHMLYWLNERHEMMSLPVPEALQRTVGNIYSGGFSASEFERALRETRKRFVKDLNVVAKETPSPEPVATNMRMLVDELGLPASAYQVTGLIACYTRFDQVQYLCDSLTESTGPLVRVIALLTGEPAREVERMLSAEGELVASGLVQIEEGDQIAGHGGRYKIPRRVDTCLDRTFEDITDMRRALLGEPLSADIVLDDYEHIAADRDMLTKVLRGAADNHERGVNILLYGAPGTGKTELTKVAAATSELALYGAGEDAAAERESDRSGRLADLVFSLRLLSETPRTALLFDEMEDIAWQLMRRGGSKVYLNRLLETNPIPVLWTSNNIHEIDPALLRRMTLAIEMRLPPAPQRQRIVARLAKRQDVALTDAEVERLARRVEATPAVFENALRAAKLAGGGAEAVERAALGIVRAVTGLPGKRELPTPEFDASLICADLDLRQLSNQLCKAEARQFSLCLSGPPGTGKSAYARHLARRLGLEVVHKRASDLLSAFIGESEKRIAEAFDEAREAGAFLIFDEADSFLFDRTQALRSWEITQVNEMLTWMEDHPLPVCFTTNLMDRLDAASLRRFTFHVRFQFLDRAALQRAFATFFDMRNVPAEGLALTNLTPGDFAQARKQARVLGVADKPDRVVALLTELSRAKPGGFGRIGF